jgi:putative DNA primase/helicase
MNVEEAGNYIRDNTPLMVDLLKPAKYGYICPCCGNGSGEDGTGAEISKDGTRLLCGKCQGSFTNIDLIAVSVGAGIVTFGKIIVNDKDYVEVVKIGAERRGIDIDNDYSSNSKMYYKPTKLKIQSQLKKKKSEAEIAQEKAETEMIVSDISAAQNHLKELPETQRRGLTLETLQHFHCGYLPNWTSPTSRISGKFATPTPRLIIPAGKHYLARLTVPVETYDENTRKYIKPKQHAGHKELFGAETLAVENEVVYVFEGEIDEMSSWQTWLFCLASKFKAAFIATAGASSNNWYDDLDKVFGGDNKPLIIIVADNDNTGKETSSKHRQELLKRGYPTTVEYFSDGEEKIDANSVLINQGEDDLARFLLTFWNNAQNNIDGVKSEIKLIQTQMQAADEEARKQEFQRKIKFALSNSGNLTDLQNAKRIAAMLGDKVRFIQDMNCWSTYNGGIWKIDSSGENSVLLPLIVKMADDLNRAAKNEDEGKIAAKFAKTRSVVPALTFLKGIVYITKADLDKHKNLICCGNGVVNLEDGKIYPHSSELLFTQKCNANYKIGCRSATIDKFLKDIQPNEDNRNALTRWLGYSLSGETKAEKFLFIDGKGGNGKGTLTSLMMKLLGDLAVVIPARGLMLGKPTDANNATPVLNALVGKRFAITEELPPNTKLDTALIKSLSGRDKLYYRRLHHEAESFDAQFKLTLSGNNLPELLDAKDKGFARRLLRLKFESDFTGSRCDEGLKDRLQSQENIDAFFYLLVQNAVEWYKSGLIVTSDMQAAAQEYLADEDFLGEFISSYCEFDAESSITRREFVEELKVAYPSQTSRLSDRALTEMLKKAEGVEYTRSNGARRLKGIKWRDKKDNE